mmetsp:Transcript_885/g.3702  ORF Transcript_885/g.3702 Transcript_885/m.3702 type:complete len:323 (-) Transcript_885:88-1056(-)
MRGAPRATRRRVRRPARKRPRPSLRPLPSRTPRALPPPRARRRRTCPASAGTAGTPWTWRRRATAGNTPRSTRVRTLSQPPKYRPCISRTRSRLLRHPRMTRPLEYPRRMRWKAGGRGLARKAVPLAPVAPRPESRPRLCDARLAESGCRTRRAWRGGTARRRNRTRPRRGHPPPSRAPVLRLRLLRSSRLALKSLRRRSPRRTKPRGERLRRSSPRDSPNAPPRCPRRRCPSSRRVSARAGGRGRTPPGRGRVCTPGWRGTSTPGGGSRPAQGWRTRGSRPRRPVTRWRGRAEDPAARRSVEKHTARWSRVPGVSVPRRCR